MSLCDTHPEWVRLRCNNDDFVALRLIAQSGNDHPVLMPNMNRCTPDAGFPNRMVTALRMRKRTCRFPASRASRALTKSTRRSVRLLS